MFRYYLPNKNKGELNKAYTYGRTGAQGHMPDLDSEQQLLLRKNHGHDRGESQNIKPVSNVRTTHQR